ncbi:MAG: hypothetical protein WDN25_15275 [Acetobacteraceae bacterium]
MAVHLVGILDALLIFAAVEHAAHDIGLTLDLSDQPVQRLPPLRSRLRVGGFLLQPIDHVADDAAGRGADSEVTGELEQVLAVVFDDRGRPAFVGAGMREDAFAHRHHVDAERERDGVDMDVHVLAVDSECLVAVLRLERRELVLREVALAAGRPNLAQQRGIRRGEVEVHVHQLALRPRFAIGQIARLAVLLGTRKELLVRHDGGSHHLARSDPRSPCVSRRGP